MIDLSPGLKAALLASDHKTKTFISNTAISLGDGDGAGGLDTINAAAGGLDIFPKHSYVHVLTEDGDPNMNTLVKVLSSSATKLEVAANSLTAYAANAGVVLQQPDIAGSVKSLFKNCTIKLFSESRAANAGLAEPGSSICNITLNGGTFTPGSPLNGLNFGDMDGEYLRRAIDPETGASEVMQGDPLFTQTARSFMCYANDVITGDSINSIRFNGDIGVDMILANGPSLTVGVPVYVTSVKFVVKPTTFS